MKKVILLLASKMLEMASEEFSNNSCNDLENNVLEILKTVDETEFCEQMQKWMKDFEYPEGFEQIQDSTLMNFLSFKLK